MTEECAELETVTDALAEAGALDGLGPLDEIDLSTITVDDISSVIETVAEAAIDGEIQLDGLIFEEDLEVYDIELEV